MGWRWHQMNAKTVLQNNWTKSVCRETSMLWGIPKRDLCMKIEEDNLVENLQCTTKVWWRLSIKEILYQNDYSEDQDDGLPIHDKYLMMTEEVPLGYVPSLTLSTMLWASRKQKSWIQLWRLELYEAFRKPVFQKDRSALRSIIRFFVMKSRKEKWFSNIYLHRWADKQIFW